MIEKINSFVRWMEKEEKIQMKTILGLIFFSFISGLIWGNIILK